MSYTKYDKYEIEYLNGEKEVIDSQELFYYDFNMDQFFSLGSLESIMASIKKLEPIIIITNKEKKSFSLRNEDLSIKKIINAYQIRAIYPKNSSIESFINSQDQNAV